MARQLLTCRRSTIPYHHTRPMESPLIGEVTHFQFHHDQHVDDGTILQAREPMEDLVQVEYP